MTGRVENVQRFLFYERLHFISLNVFNGDINSSKLSFRVTARYLDQNSYSPQFYELSPIEVLCTSLYHCIRYLRKKNYLTEDVSFGTITQVANKRLFPPNQPVRVYCCLHELEKFGDAGIEEGISLCQKISSLVNVDNVESEFCMNLLDNTFLEKIVTEDSEESYILAALMVSRIFIVGGTDFISTPINIWMLKLAHRIQQSVLKLREQRRVHTAPASVSPIK